MGACENEKGKRVTCNTVALIATLTHLHAKPAVCTVCRQGQLHGQLQTMLYLFRAWQQCLEGLLLQ